MHIPMIEHVNWIFGRRPDLKAEDLHKLVCISGYF